VWRWVILGILLVLVLESLLAWAATRKAGTNEPSKLQSEYGA
jgi:hypothetical protein